MATTDLKAMLAMTPGQVERPKALPEMWCTGKILRFEFGRSAKKQTPFVRFYLQPNGAAEGSEHVDIEGIDLARKELRTEFYFTPTSLYRLSDFLDAVLGKEERSFDERIPECKGVEVVFKVTQRESDREAGTFFNDVGMIMRADDFRPELAAAA